MANKRKGEEVEPGAPSWVLTYGDMMSLLLTFFILLVAFSNFEERKVKEAISSLKGALGVLPKHEAAITIPFPKPEIKKIQRVNQDREKMQRFQQQMKQQGLSEQRVKILGNEEGVINIRLDSQLLFPSGSADLLPSAALVLGPVGELLKYYIAEYDADIRIEGHTDDVPIRSAQFPSNWELSSARSLSVLKFMRDQYEVAEKHFGVAGYAEFKPLQQPVQLEENRRANRRVEIIVIPKIRTEELAAEDITPKGAVESVKLPMPRDDQLETERL